MTSLAPKTHVVNGGYQDDRVWFDQRPTRRPWSDEMVKADQERAAVWKQYDLMSERPMSLDEREAINEAIDSAENYFLACKRRWEAGQPAKQEETEYPEEEF